MSIINKQLLQFKALIEDAIISGGAKGKESLIRSSDLINLIHDAVKLDLIESGVKQENIYPHFGQSKPEIKLAGFLKQKDQDVCVIPSNIEPTPTKIIWGPMQYENLFDSYGTEYTSNTLVINVRSQMSSIAKNADTLFERTFAEALNLHLCYADIVLGEVYLIPTCEYDDEMVKEHKVGFKTNHINLEKYISFFNSISGRTEGNEEPYKYERCALLIVDFSKKKPYLFKNTMELKKAGLVSEDFSIEYANINYQNFVTDILSEYGKRFNLKNLLAD